ncbi:MAG: serpin family protein [Ardenticatenales bacterium]|nr:serpin family protein [Ardenticatenales bacterium]
MLVLLPVAGFLTGCGTTGNSQAVARVQSEKPREQAPQVAEDDLTELAAGNHEFAWELYGAVRDEPGNLFYSPYSISLALAMTHAGARGQTAQEMAETLHFTLPEARLHPAFNRVTLDLVEQGDASEEKSFRLNIANALWGQKEYTFLPEFLDLLATQYGAGMRLLDFKSDSEAARKSINAWVSEQTEEKIENLIPPGVLDESTRLVLTNAIYFYGKWQAPFDKAQTRDGPFHLLEGGEVTVPMMHQDGSFRYGAGEGYQIIELPYAGSDMAMIVLLPAEDHFQSFEESIDAARVDEMVQGLEHQSMALTLPKFTYESEFALSEALSNLGMPSAFSASQADFSGMDGTRNLVISEVIHKAFVAVDEEGTEAAAATAVVMAETSAMIPDLEVTVDRPFLFLIRDNATGTLLFAGRVLDPTGK